MTSATARPLSPGTLCEMLLRQGPACAWLLRRDGIFHALYGDTASVFGRTSAELVGSNFTDGLVRADRQPWLGCLERVFARELFTANARFGEAAMVSVTLFPVEADDRSVIFAGGMAHNVPATATVLRALESLETDRARLSELLHDHLGQELSAAGLQLDLLRMDLAQTGLPIPQRIGEIQAMLEEMMDRVREVNREINPAVAERLGLRAALDRLAGSLRADFQGNVRVFADATAQPAPRTAAALYRIAQEAAGRAARRTGCSAIEILLKSLRSGPALEIRDNAPGCDAARNASAEGTLEFLVMRYFADRADIELQIEGTPETGTVVRAICRTS